MVVACLLFLATVVGGDQLVAKPLPGNKACAFPPQAQKEFVAGPVQFVALIRPDGTVESVDVSRVPLPRLGFEDAVRACVSEWRFDAASPGGGLRRYEGHVRFRLDTSEEAAIRGLLEALEAAWNSGDMKAVEDLAPAIR